MVSPAHLLDGAAWTADVTSLLYGATVSVVALTAVFAQDSDRRRDARQTLKMLRCRRSIGKDST
jgi:hypothetical protein